jgi:hypothetical protein
MSIVYRKSTWILWLCFLSHAVLAQDYIITDFGAKADSSYINTKAINSAIEACSQNGGGRVIIPAGVYKSGTLLMKNNVELHLNTGATLLASTDIKDFPIQPQPEYRSQKDPGGWRALIYADDASHISITGLGTIDGNGANQRPDPEFKGLGGDLDGRPRNLLFISCNHVFVQGIHMINSGIWNQHYLNCEDVIVDHIQVYNHSNRNNDGIDIDGCRRFILSNAVFDTDDDAVVLKSTGPAAAEDVVITNCIVSSSCNAIKAGTESTGGFKNISISNCIIKPSRDKNKPIYGQPGGITGISLEITDGGTMEGVTISNITIEGTACPLYIRLGNRARKYMAGIPQPPVGKMRDISINNLVAYGTGNYCSSITGIPGHFVENVSLSHIQLYNEGGLDTKDYIAGLDDVKEDEKGYPQPTTWGNLPSSGLFIRHAKNIQISDLMLGAANSEPRVPVMAEDVEGLQIKNTGRVKNSSARVFFYGKNVRNVSVDKPLGWDRPVIQMKK